MYAMTRLIPLRALLLEQLPALTLALVIAETLYKFKSFTLECLAFLATWYAVDRGLGAVRRLLGDRATDRG
jgi:hypothetical protein